MRSARDLIHDLTDNSIPRARRRDLAKEFSSDFGWRPNDFIETTSTLSTASLVVEHGLDNAAVLSFLPSDRRLRDIQISERRTIVGVSYNSLVDWHVWVDRESIEYVYNRSNLLSPIDIHRFDGNDYSVLTKSVFDQATGKAPNPNVPTLDWILLDTIATWRRILRSELGMTATNESISALFNAIIFARAIEDFHARSATNDQHTSLRDYIAIKGVNIVDAIESLIIERTKSSISADLFDKSTLKPFLALSQSITRDLVSAFYGHPSVPYGYDFSVMSKHALSKIYERYVAVMQHDVPIQFSMFPSAPEEAWNKRLGGIYTPQYIASFFARYLRAQLSPEQFIHSSVLDPACGSGIFLRAVMEEKIAISDGSSREAAKTTLDSLRGIDIDENAVAASGLSLALLYLATCGELPQDIPIHSGDSLELLALDANEEQDSFDVIMMNPPFIRTELQSEAMRQSVIGHVGTSAKGKLDTYLAFLSLAIRTLRPGGFGFFVVPQPLLTSDNLAKLRQWIQDEAWIRVVADLSAIRVFAANVYVALLIVQRKDELALGEPVVSFIRCQRDVGSALEDFLDGRRQQTHSYLTFDAPQTSLGPSTWAVHTPEEADVIERLATLPRLSDLAVVRQGAITGADEIFIINEDDVPHGEEVLYQAFLPDKMIGRFGLPEETGRRIFYPFVDGIPITTAVLEKSFPTTWDRLQTHEEELSSRSSVREGGLEWWRPVRPRPPHEMLAPKIVVPELFLVPRFGLDISGRWVVSHSPFVYVSKKGPEEDMLLFLTAILNSSITSWFVDMNARKYRSQYNKLGVSLLRKMPIPDIGTISSNTLRRVMDITRVLVHGYRSFDRDLALSLDQIVLEHLYGLSSNEKAIISSIHDDVSL